MIIVMVSAIIGSGALAYLGNSGRTSDNVFAAEILDLRIKDQDERFYKDGVTATWTMFNMKPGDSTIGWVRLINKGNMAADHLEISVSNSVIDPSGPESDTEEGTTDMDGKIIITCMIYGGVRIIVDGYINSCYLNDMNGDGKISLHELEAQGIDNLPAPGMKQAKTLITRLKFDPDADNDYQGDIMTSTFTFTLEKN